MRTFLLTLIGVLMIMSCTQSPEKKAESLICDSMKKTLIIADSYEPVETRLDSAFIPYDRPEFYERALELYKYGIQIQQCDEEAKMAKSSMAIWSGPYQTSYGKNEYNESKAKYDEVVAQKEMLTVKWRRLLLR